VSASVITSIPGSSVAHAVVTDECREKKGDWTCYDEALHRLREQYAKVVKGWPVGNGAKIHIVLTVERAE
jgi:hypothetical protein